MPGGHTATTAANALFDRMAEARLVGAGLDRSLFTAIRDAAKRFGPSHPIVEDVVTGTLTYRKLFIGARVLGRRFAAMTEPGEAVGVLLPNANGGRAVAARTAVGRPRRRHGQLHGGACERHRGGAHGDHPDRRLVTRVHGKSRPRRHHRSRRKGRRETGLAGGYPRQRHRAGEALGGAALALFRCTARRRRSRRSSSSPPARKARPRPSCCRTGTCSPTPCRPRRASRSRLPTSC